MSALGGKAKVAKDNAMIPALFGDDEHTGAEGAYSRMLKARKWLYISAAFAIFHSYYLIDLVALKKITFGILSVPAWMITNALVGGLAYLLLQYALLLYQLYSSYDAIIAIRLPDSARTANARLGVLNIKALVVGTGAEMEEAGRAGADVVELSRKLYEYEGKLAKFEAELRSSLAENSTSRPEFRVPEFLIDLLRSSIPLIIALAAIVRIVQIYPGY